MAQRVRFQLGFIRVYDFAPAVLALNIPETSRAVSWANHTGHTHTQTQRDGGMGRGQDLEQRGGGRGNRNRELHNKVCS